MLAKMTGVAGQLRVSNQVAAELGAWSMVPADEPGCKAVQAECVSVDRWLAAQEPDVLILTVGIAPAAVARSRAWRWATAPCACVVAGAPR